ncbi:hypothetical protein [Thiobacillus sp. 65-1402]|nr:hypothetical protein [Thiobacillus sp. 65-1402]
MNFGTRNELSAYNAQRRAEQAERADTIIAAVCLAGMAVMVLLAAAGVV